MYLTFRLALVATAFAVKEHDDMSVDDAHEGDSALVSEESEVAAATAAARAAAAKAAAAKAAAERKFSYFIPGSFITHMPLLACCCKIRSQFNSSLYNQLN